MLERMRIAPWILLGLGCLLAVSGFVANHMWTTVPPSPARLLALLASISLVGTYGLVRFFKCRPATGMLLIWSLALVYFVGLSASVAVILIVMAAAALGGALVPEGWSARPALSVLVGLALICGLVGWLLPMPVHFRASYTVALLVLTAWRRRDLIAMARSIPEAWRDAVDAAPWPALLAVLALGAASTCAWGPTIRADDLAFHLGLPSQLASLGYYRMDVGSSLWALSAWASDVLQGVARVVATGDARGAVNAMWFAIGLVLQWKFCESLGLRAGLRWVAVALYASVPLTATTLGGMQTEGPSAAVAMALALLIQGTPLPDRRRLLVAALIFGLLLELKISNLTLAGPMGLWLLWRWRGHLPWRTVPTAVLLALLVAGSSYAYSYLLTGNPVLPLFNKLFQSPYYPPVDFSNHVWNTGFHWGLVWDLVFHTSRYIEGGDGEIGFFLVALGGCLLVGLARPQARPVTVVALACFLLPLSQTQYVRYAQPSFALLIPAMLCGMPDNGFRPFGKRVAAAVLTVLVLSNLLYIANSDWEIRSGSLEILLTDGKQAVLDRYAPEREVAEVIRTLYGDDARTLVSDRTHAHAAELAGNAYALSWYDPELSSLALKADGDPSGAAWSKVIAHAGVNLVLLREGQYSAGLQAAIASDRGIRVYQKGDLELWELHPGRAGEELPAPAKAVILKFATTAAPKVATLLHAEMNLACRPMDAPIVVAWQVGVAGKPQAYYSWAQCTPGGSARTTIDMATPGPITALSVTATPAKSLDMGLKVISSRASFRSDLTAERNLGRRWQERPLSLIKAANRRRLARYRAAKGAASLP